MTPTDEIAKKGKTIKEFQHIRGRLAETGLAKK